MYKYLRYSAPKDHSLIEEFVDSYDTLIVNAHISSYYAKSLSEFLHTNSADYVIDPRSFIFQMPPNEIYEKKRKVNLSSSYKKLFDLHYSDEMIDKFLSKGNGFGISDLELYYSDILKGSISSQLNAFDDTQYKESLLPSVLIAPSFALLKDYSPDELSRVLQMNINFIKYCNENYSSVFKIGTVLILDKDILLTPSVLQNIINYYSMIQMDYLYLWIDDFNCFKSDVATLKAYYTLINGLRSCNIIDLYADYSSFMLCSINSPAPMIGVCITAGYNEYRTIRGVMGMSPAAKYYMQDIHMRFPPADFMSILAAREFFQDSASAIERAEKFFTEICSCPVCRDVIRDDINNIRQFTQVITTKGGRQQSASSSLILAQRHFLYAKLQEAEKIEQNGYKVLSRQIEDALLDYVDHGLTGLQGISHWLNVFK